MKEAIEFTLGTSNTAFNSGLAAAKSSVSKFKGEVTGMVTGLFAGIGIQQLVSEFARVQDLADMFGTSAEAIQKVKGAAEQAGTSVELIARAMAKIRSDGGDALEKLGIDATAFANSGMDEQVLMISEALEKIEDPQQRINFALDVFGAKGKELLPLLTQGYDKLKASMAATSVASNETVARLALIDDKVESLTTTMKSWVAVGIGGAISGIEKMSTAAAYLWAVLNSPIQDIGQVTQDFQEAEGLRLLQAEVAAEKKKEKAKQNSGINTESASTSGGKSTAEKIADLEAEAVRNSLPLYQQIAAIGMQRLDLERAIAAENDPDAKKELEEQLLANTKERLSLEAQNRKDGEAFDQRLADEKENELKAQEADQAKAAAKSLSDAKRLAEEKSKIENEMMMKLFEARQADLGFASGNSGFSGTGQQFGGVNYSAINAEAQKGLALQEEMKNYLRSIDQKNWTVEIPEAE